MRRVLIVVSAVLGVGASSAPAAGTPKACAQAAAKASGQGRTACFAGRELRIVDARGRTVRVRRFARSDRDAWVAITSRGEAVWRYEVRAGRWEIGLDRKGPRPRVVERFTARPDVGLTGGTTIRIGTPQGDRLVELAKRPRGADGCPRRTGAKAFGRAGRVVLRTIRTQMWGGEDATDVLLCDPAKGTEGILDTGRDLFGSANRLTFVAGTPRVVVLREVSKDRYSPFAAPRLVAHVLGRPGRIRTQLGARKPAAPVVLDSGVVAWIDREADGTPCLVAATGAGDSGPVVLDRGAIGDVRADGTVLRWTSNGVAREQSF